MVRLQHGNFRNNAGKIINKLAKANKKICSKKIRPTKEGIGR